MRLGKFFKNFAKSFGNFGKGCYNIDMEMRADCNGELARSTRAEVGGLEILE